MENKKKRILIVDDNADDIHVLLENLKTDYAVLIATSGKRALELAEKDTHIDIILLDVIMPEMDGYEACRRLKSNPLTQDIDVIFVSAHDTTDEKMTGYEAGGSDYLIKPVNPRELLQKIKLAIKIKASRVEANIEKTIAVQTAMTAITNSGEQGVILSFMRQSFTAKNIEILANLIVEATSSYDLENSVQIRGLSQVVNASTTKPMSPLEQEILNRMKGVGRLKEKGSHFVANYGPVTLLIKNMPNDEEKRGRLRDHLAILAEGAEARIRALETNEQMTNAIKESNNILDRIQSMQKKQKEKSMQIIDNILMQLETSFLSYGLTEDQENVLLDIVKDGVEKSLENYEQGQKIDDQLRNIINGLITVSDQL